MSNSRRARRHAARSRPAGADLRDWPLYSPQASGVLLRESTAVLDAPDTTVEATVPTVEVSNRPWSDFSRSDYTPAQWRRACLIDTGQGAEDSKERYALPVKEPSGTVNRNGVHAAASRINQVDVSADKKRTAARALIRIYRSDLDEEPPPGLRSLAGEGQESHRERTPIRETVTGAIREAPSGSPLTVDVQIIEAGWNKSGSRFYPAEVLARDVPRVYPAGTHMYLDHPTLTEEAELPERSVTRLAAVLAEDPYTTDGGRTMRARARIFAPHREFLAEAWRDIGVSINGEGDGQWGEKDGRQGLIIESLTAGRSVDFVTRAGAGGRILQLFESAVNIREARNIGAWLEARIHRAFTSVADEMYGDGRLTRPERITLSGAIGDALGAFVERIDSDAAQLYTRDLFEEPTPPQQAAQSSAVIEADPATQDAGGTPPAAPTDEGGESLMPEGTQNPGTTPAPAGTDGGLSPVARAEIAEAQLREAQARISELSTQNATLTVERDTARTELGRMRITEAARGAVTTALAECDLPDPARQRVTESVTRDVPTTQDGQLDTVTLTNRINEAVNSERSYIASLRESAGAGQPSGLGGGAPQVVDAAQFQSNLVESFKGLGMSEQAAIAAANGR